MAVAVVVAVAVAVAVVVAGAARHLQALLAELVLDRLLEAAVVDRRDLDSGEEVLDDRHEERDVVVQELGEVRVAERADQRDVLADLRVGALELPRHHEDRLHRAHSEVVVVLLAELLGGQLVQLGHFVREPLRLAEACRGRGAG